MVDTNIVDFTAVSLH